MNIVARLGKCSVVAQMIGAFLSAFETILANILLFIFSHNLSTLMNC